MVTSTRWQEAEVRNIEYNTAYQFRVRPVLVTAACGEIVEEGETGNASVYYNTACIGNNVHVCSFIVCHVLESV